MLRRTSLTFGNGVVQSYSFDPVSRLASLTNELSGTTNDLSATFAYNPSSQIASMVRTGDSYAWTGHANTNVNGTANGLNQLTSVGPKSLTHDARGNVTAFGTKSFTYSSENLLLTGPGSTTLSYDPAMRLYESVAGGSTQRFAYDGLDRIAEYDGSNALQRRYVHGPSTDEPLVWYEGSGTTDRRFLSSDERGSVISLTDNTGSLVGTGINRYDEFGTPQATNLGAFGYTGQAWLSGPGIWYYKARAYDPELGRFLQTDPIGYEGGINLYAYVSNDPVNGVDPTGTVLEWIARYVCVAGNCGWSGYYTWVRGPGSTGGGAGSTGKGGGRPRASEQPKPKLAPEKPRQCRMQTYQAGAGVTLAVFGGINVSVNFGIAVPEKGFGLQVFASPQVAVMGGPGFFVGAGVSGSYGKNAGPVASSLDGFLYGEADVGWGPAVGVSGQVSKSGGSVSIPLPAPKVGAGYGAYAGAGVGGSATLAKTLVPNLGC